MRHVYRPPLNWSQLMSTNHENKKSNTNAVLLTSSVQTRAHGWPWRRKSLEGLLYPYHNTTNRLESNWVRRPSLKSTPPPPPPHRNFEELLVQQFFSFTVNHKQHEAPSKHKPDGGVVRWGGEGVIVERGCLWSNACLIEGSLTRKSLDSPPHHVSLPQLI